MLEIFVPRCSRSTLLLAAYGVHCFIVNASQQVVYPFHTESMALLKYFSQRSAFLLDLNKPLFVKVKPEVIDNANKKVTALLASCSSKIDSAKQQRGLYIPYAL